MRVPGVVKRALPWVGSGVLVTYMAMTTDLSGVADALEAVSLPLLGLLLFAGTLIGFFVDSAGVMLGFREVGERVTFRETLPIKATSYFLNILNYNAALAGMALYVHRSRGVGFWKALGALMLVNVVDLFMMLMLLAVGMTITWGTDAFDPTVGTTLRIIAWSGLAAFIGGLLWFRSDLPMPVIGRLRDKALFLAIREASLGTWGRLLAVRILLEANYLTGAWLLLMLFDIHIPFIRMLAYVPVLTFIQIVPISISGIGTTQLAMRTFYTPYVQAVVRSPGAVIDACSSMGIIGFSVLRIGIAYLFLGNLSRDIIRHGADAPDEPPA